MAEFKLNAEVRTRTGKGDSRRLRCTGNVPAVIYGRNVDPIHCVISRQDVEKTVQNAPKNTIIKINFKDSPDKGKDVIIRDYQKHPISHIFTHIDFQAIDMSKPIQIEVDVNFTGTPVGKKVGAIFTTQNKTVRIECLPSKIPQAIDLDVTNMGAGDSMHVSQLPTGDYKIITNPKITLCQMSIIKEEVVVAAPTAEGAATTAVPGAATAAPTGAPAAPATGTSAKKEG